MQFSVTDRAAMSFAGAFYGDLVARGDVELAVSSGRRAVAGARRGPEPEFSPYRSAEWSTPVLHLEAGGRLFASQPSAPPVVAGAAPSPPIVLLPERPASAGTAGRLQETSRNVWLLTFDTELEQAHALGRVEVGIRATMDVRRIDRTAHGLTASIGGLVPGTFAATEIVTATFTRSAGLTSVGIESRPRHGTVLFDYGRNEGALERLARHLSVTTA
jgi:hypothetical protein